MTQKLIDRPWKRALWVAALAALAYFPRALQLTLYRDDWYYAYDALVGPAGVFRFMFLEDRPVRGPFFELYQALFRVAPLPYHLAMFFWRAAGGAAVVWLFHLCWPKQHAPALAAGALFAIYPGFTWWVQGIEYQPMVTSAALMVLSLALTVQALRLPRGWLRAACIAAAILTGWLYLSLVEYAAGMEVVRLGLIFLFLETPRLGTFRTRAGAALRAWVVYLIIPAGFLLWRFVLFTSERRATDLGLQLGGLFSEPVTTLLRWILSSLVSLFNVALAAWVDPLLENFFSGTLREQALGLALALAAGALGWWLLNRDQPDAAQKQGSETNGWQVQALWIGLVVVVMGIAPVVVVNRQITLARFSHYALPASLGMVFAITGAVGLISARWLRTATYTALIFLSALTHQGLGTAAVREERTIAGFWHQMSWRAPTLAPGTTLLVYYPGVDYGTDSDVVWGPANFIYNMDPQERLPIQVPISAITADRDALNRLLSARDIQESTYRAHTMNIDPGKALISVQSSAGSCVRVIDRRWPTFSSKDDPALRALADRSDIDLVEPSAPPPDVPEAHFGPEPEHGWCFYFERASLAAQTGDWEQVAALQTELGGRGLHPNDQVEWMPFLQAQAYLGDLKAVKDLATRINTDRLYRLQACVNLNAMAEHGYPLAADAQAYVNELFCTGAS